MIAKQLSDLACGFVAGHTETASVGLRKQYVADQAQGIIFRCPKCDAHSISLWFRNPINATKPEFVDESSRNFVTRVGSTVETFGVIGEIEHHFHRDKIDHPGVFLAERDCRWRGTIRDGKVTVIE